MTTLWTEYRSPLPNLERLSLLEHIGRYSSCLPDVVDGVQLTQLGEKAAVRYIRPGKENEAEFTSHLYQLVPSHPEYNIKLHISLNILIFIKTVEPVLRNRLSSVVEPFHFDPALAPASQDGGSGSSSVVNNFLL